MAAAGQVGLLVALFLPWYSGIPPTEDAVSEDEVEGEIVGILEVPVEDTTVSAWQAFGVLDVGLLVGAVAGLLLLRSADRRAAGAALGISLLAFAACLYRVLDPPGAEGGLTPAVGAGIALAALAVAAGGAIETWRARGAR